MYPNRLTMRVTVIAIFALLCLLQTVQPRATGTGSKDERVSGSDPKSSGQKSGQGGQSSTVKSSSAPPANTKTFPSPPPKIKVSEKTKAPEKPTSPDRLKAPKRPLSPERAKAHEKAKSPEITKSPENAKTPENAKDPEITKSAETSKAPEITKSPEVSKSPEISNSPENAKSPEITNSPEVSKSPEIPESPAKSRTPRRQKSLSRSLRRNMATTSVIAEPKAWRTFVPPPEELAAATSASTTASTTASDSDESAASSESLPYNALQRLFYELQTMLQSVSASFTSAGDGNVQDMSILIDKVKMETPLEPDNRKETGNFLDKFILTVVPSSQYPSLDITRLRQTCTKECSSVYGYIYIPEEGNNLPKDPLTFFSDGDFAPLTVGKVGVATDQDTESPPSDNLNIECRCESNQEFIDLIDALGFDIQFYESLKSESSQKALQFLKDSLESTLVSPISNSAFMKYITTL